MPKVLSIYDGKTRKRLAYLQNAYNVSYVKTANALWTGSFSLPYSDPKAKYCQSFNLVECWDQDAGGKDRYIGLFRIMPQTQEMLGLNAHIVYQFEHVLSTLLDDIMLGYHEIGNIGIHTDMAIGYILNLQADHRWILKDCDYSHQYLYGWQNENLLSALFSIVQPFTEVDYYWEFETQGFPWSLSLKRTNPEPKLDIRYRKNLNGLTRIVDPRNLTTRLYCYGYGDGDNVLGISELNGGLPYLDSQNIAKYGVITQTWTDARFTIAESLLDTGLAMLSQLEEPVVSYDLDIQTVNTAGDLELGDVVRVVAPGMNEYMIVSTISKDDVFGRPQSGRIGLGKGTIDISTSLAELADRQRISETYSQGAESIFTDSFTDNADIANPAEVTFMIPDNVVHVNEIIFSCALTNFRAYSKAVKGGGGGDRTTDNGGSSTITSQGGGANLLSSQAGGEMTQASRGGGGITIGSAGGGGSVPTTSTVPTNTLSVTITQVLPDSDLTKLHNHGMTEGPILNSIALIKDEFGKVIDVSVTAQNFIWSGDHTHVITIPAHDHTLTLANHYHDVYFPTHQHDIYIPVHSHGIDIPAHNHAIDLPAHHHDFSLPNHVHDIEYGIYKGPAANEMSVYLDNVLLGVYSQKIQGLNLIAHMSKNSANGKIMRGPHVIKIIPNQLTRVECVFQIRLFTNMHGGNQY